MKKFIILLIPLLIFAPTRTFFCDQGWGYYYWLFGPIGPNHSEGMAAAGYQSVEYRGYVQFDTYSYPGAGTVINSLGLRLRNNTGGSGLQIDLNRVTSDIPGWQECGGTAPVYATNLAVNSSPEVYTYFDLSGTQAVDDFLTQWQVGNWFGLGMKGSRGTGEPCMHFFYAFWANEIYDAALLVDYGIVGVQETEIPNSKSRIPRTVLKPNPTRDVVDIIVQVTENDIGGETSLIIYNCIGRIVYANHLPAIYRGRSVVQWDCTDSVGRKVPPGIYFVTILGGEYSCIKKLIVLR